MSRTFRRKNETQEYYWVLRDWDAYWYFRGYTYESVARYTNYLPKSKEGKKLLNKYHGDAGTHQCKEPGPSWYRRITRQVPLRRSSKEQLRKFMLDEEFEVIIEENPPLEYWT